MAAEITAGDCYAGRCDCESGAQCKFKRCSNCDNLVDDAGKWIDDCEWHGEDPDWCPDCGAAMKRQ